MKKLNLLNKQIPVPMNNSQRMKKVNRSSSAFLNLSNLNLTQQQRSRAARPRKEPSGGGRGVTPPAAAQGEGREGDESLGVAGVPALLLSASSCSVGRSVELAPVMSQSTRDKLIQWVSRSALDLETLDFLQESAKPLIHRSQEKTFSIWKCSRAPGRGEGA